METLYQIVGKTLIIYLGSELDHHNASIIKKQSDWYIINNSIQNIVFDFNNTEFMDSSGIGIIMGRYRLVEHLKGRIAVVNLKPPVERIFHISGLYKIAKKYDSLEQAVME